mgnify:CR=1 FL=1
MLQQATRESIVHCLRFGIPFHIVCLVYDTLTFQIRHIAQFPNKQCFYRLNNTDMLFSPVEATRQNQARELFRLSHYLYMSLARLLLCDCITARLRRLLN